MAAPGDGTVRGRHYPVAEGVDGYTAFGVLSGSGDKGFLVGRGLGVARGEGVGLVVLR